MPIPKQLRYGNTRSPGTPRLPLWVLAGVVLGLSACGHAQLVHVDGTPFHEQQPRIALDHGWIAVDSCATGHHAVLHLEVEGVRPFPLVPRWINTPRLGTMRDFSIDGPWCRTEYQGFFEEEYDEPPGLWKNDGFGMQQHCVYQIRAEYTLAEAPTADSVLLADLRGVPARER